MSSISSHDIVQWLKLHAPDVTDRAKLESCVPDIAEHFELSPKAKLIADGITIFITMGRPFTSVNSPISCEEPRDSKFQIVRGEYFNRLREYLIDKKGRSPGVVGLLSDEADRVALNLAIPNSDEKRKGQVVGFVQSGKTANMAALCAKAMDGGYKVIVVFAGVLNNLREQTQVRLQSELVGSEGGVKMFESLLEPIPLTRRGDTESEGDVDRESERILKLVETRNNSKDNIYLFVIKKRPNRLKFLKDIFATRLSQLPTLIIDDESDQASINSGTNLAIRNLLRTLKNFTFIGYSATPYANFLIDKNFEEDLFPRDFIISLDEPPQYFGAKRLFGLPKPGEDDELNALPVHCELNDEEVGEFEDSKNKTNAPVPSFLKRGIVIYLLASATRDIRHEKFGNAVDKNFKSMLIHAYSEIKGHNQITGMTRKVLKELIAQKGSKEFRNYFEEIWRAEFDSKKENFLDTLKSFNETIPEGLKYDCNVLLYPEFIDVFNKVLQIIEKVDVRKVHSDGDPFSYVSSDSAKKVQEYSIVVGGNKLSRGFTIEGLMISLFLRGSNQADTLMQMGRWFGYRPGYVDLTRVMTTNEIFTRFLSLAYMEDQMREDIRVRIVKGLTPKELPPQLKVIGGLRLTSASKMGAGILLADFKSIYQKTNWNIHAKSLEKMKSHLQGINVGEIIKRDDRGRVLFSNQFSSDEVIKILKVADYKNEQLDLIKNQMERAPNIKWSVAVAGKQTKSKEEIKIGTNLLSLPILDRGLKKILIDGDREFGVIHSSSDFEWVDETSIADKNSGILMFYLFRGTFKKVKEGTSGETPLFLAPVIMFPESAKFDEQIYGQPISSVSEDELLPDE